MNNKCLYIPFDRVKQDPAFSLGERGDRKLLVTDIREEKEQEASSDIWSPPTAGQKCPVLRISNAEMAVFNQVARQDRHYHKEGTEIYMAVEGQVIIEVEGKTYRLNQGDSIVVHPFSVHEVKNEGNEFFCRVITLNCGGEKDKYQV